MASVTLDNPPSINAQELHEILLCTHAAGNLARRRFIDSLRALHESKLYKQLGFPSIAAYADQVFHYARSQTFDFVRVSRALLELPEIAAAFDRGELHYSLVSKLIHVAEAVTEHEWLALAARENSAALLFAIENARKKGRTAPERGKFGLPGTPVKLCFELSPEEHAIVEQALRKAAREVGESLDGALPSPKEALVYLCQRILETDDNAAITAGRAEREASPFAVVIHRCHDCAAGAVDTEAGRVEIEPEALDRIERSAEVIVIDGERLPAVNVPAAARDQHNTPKIRLQVSTRDGGRCSNPYCRREVGLLGQCHHIEFWSHGGPTAVWNECLVCSVCHASLHLGLLALEGDPSRGLTWKVCCADLTRTVRESIAAIACQTQARVVEVHAESSFPDSASSVIEPAPLASMRIAQQALEKLKWTVAQARRALRDSWARAVSDGKPTEAVTAEELILDACRHDS